MDDKQHGCRPRDSARAALVRRVAGPSNGGSAMAEGRQPRAHAGYPQKGAGISPLELEPLFRMAASRCAIIPR